MGQTLTVLPTSYSHKFSTKQQKQTPQINVHSI